MIVLICLRFSSVQAAYDEACMREAMKNDHLAFLTRQAEEQRRKKEEWDATRSGVIEDGFFENFGKDAR
jgi:5-methylcytosine-specific restriction endonuclease McrA